MTKSTKNTKAAKSTTKKVAAKSATAKSTTKKAKGIGTAEVAAHISEKIGRKLSPYVLRQYLRQPAHYADKKYTRYSWPTLSDPEIATLVKEAKQGRIKRQRKTKVAKKTTVKAAAKKSTKKAAPKKATKKVSKKVSASKDVAVATS